jgi:hypothetical protein
VQIPVQMSSIPGCILDSKAENSQHIYYWYIGDTQNLSWRCGKFHIFRRCLREAILLDLLSKCALTDAMAIVSQVRLQVFFKCVKTSVTVNFGHPGGASFDCPLASTDSKLATVSLVRL